MKLSDDLQYWRAERPDEWTMDEFIRKAKKMENGCNRLQRAFNEQSNILDVCRENVQELIVKKFTRFNEDECWVYQDNGEDYLESLVCPVVICPKKLMGLIHSNKKMETLLSQINGIIIESKNEVECADGVVSLAHNISEVLGERGNENTNT